MPRLETTRRVTTRAPRGRCGFSLIEVLMATVLMAYAVSTLDALFLAGRNKALLNSNPVTARLLANEIRILARLLPRSPSGVTGVTSGLDVTALDSLDGAVFSPPILADLSRYDDLDGWTQSVELSTVDLADPHAAMKDLTPSGLDEDAAGVFRLAVTVSYLGEEVDEFAWWIRP